MTVGFVDCPGGVWHVILTTMTVGFVDCPGGVWHVY